MSYDNLPTKEWRGHTHKPGDPADYQHGPNSHTHPAPGRTPDTIMGEPYNHQRQTLINRAADILARKREQGKFCTDAEEKTLNRFLKEYPTSTLARRIREHFEDLHICQDMHCCDDNLERTV